jgi:2-methylcitrate dehydratase PrpD
MATEVTQTLANFVAGLRYDDLPPRVREHCKNLLLDALACAVAGRLGEETEQVAAFAGALAQGRESSVIGREPLSLVGATLLNAYLVTAVTMCDVYRPTLTHITPEVIPPAIAAGCEVTTRIGLGLDYPKFRARGWHGPGVIGPFGAAAAIGSLLSFNADMIARAFGLAGSQAAGTFAAWGTPTVKFHQCRGALSGLMAALLARENFVATREFLTAKDGGLYSAYADGGKPDAAIAELGTRWELEQIALRLWPSASLIQGMVTAVFDLLNEHEIDTADVRKVRVALSSGAHKMHGGFSTYKGKFEALLSAHYTAAIILHDRALSLAQFEPARYDDPRLRRFAADQVEVRADGSIEGSQASIELETVEGPPISLQCNYPLGSFENPLSRAQVEQKFRAYAQGVLPEASIAEVIGAIDRLEELGSVRRLMQLLSDSPRAMAAAE